MITLESHVKSFYLSKSLSSGALWRKVYSLNPKRLKPLKPHSLSKVESMGCLVEVGFVKKGVMKAYEKGLRVAV